MGHITFFKNESYTSYWGVQKYSGNGSQGNWPGIGNRAPLVIPGDKASDEEALNVYPAA